MIDEKQMMLAVDWVGCSFIGWLVSEKMNGCRAYWDGSQFWTRAGNVVKAPRWFTRGLPDIHLDGEIWAGRDGKHGSKSFQVASRAVRLGGKWFDDDNIFFTAFDAPQVSGGWATRMAEAKRAVKKCRAASAVTFEPINRIGDLVHIMRRLFAKNAEGGMLREPSAAYEQGRSNHLLRFKFEN